MIYYLTCGVIYYAKREPNKRHTPEFEKTVIETMLAENLNYRETMRRFEITGCHQVQNWEHIYLNEGVEGFTIEHRGRGSTGRSKKLLQEVEEDLLTEVYRLCAENDYLKNLQALVLEDERCQHRKRR